MQFDLSDIDEWKASGDVLLFPILNNRKIRVFCKDMYPPSCPPSVSRNKLGLNVLVAHFYEKLRFSSLIYEIKARPVRHQEIRLTIRICFDLIDQIADPLSKVQLVIIPPLPGIRYPCRDPLYHTQPVSGSARDRW